MYLALKAGAPLPCEALRALVCERFGWTLEYFDCLDTQDVFLILAVWDGMERAGKPRGK